MLVAIISFIIGIIVGYCYVLLSVANHIKKQSVEEEKIIKKELVPYSLEKHNNTLYAFELNDTFIAQGNSFEELSTNMQDRYPQTQFILNSYTAEVTDEMINKITKLLQGNQHD